MKLLIVFSTSEGQTRKIARFMKTVLCKWGHEVIIADASDHPPAPEGYDAVIIGASIHIQKYQPAVEQYIKRYHKELNNMPGAFFSVCLAIVSDNEEEHHAVQAITDHFLVQNDWYPFMYCQIAGVMKYKQYGFFKRLIMKMIAKREGGTTDTSKDHEYTNWHDVKKFTMEFAAKAGEILEGKKWKSMYVIPGLKNHEPGTMTHDAWLQDPNKTA